MSDNNTYVRDRLIIAAPFLIAFSVAIGVGIIGHLHFVGQMFALSIGAALAAAMSLTPMVGQARMRLLRRKYSPEE